MRALIVFVFIFNATAQNWPSFRGPAAAGAADRQGLPSTWDAAKGTNIVWRTPIAGLAHSSPIVWGDRVFVTTAVSTRPDASFKRGLYGDGDASDDRSAQKWKLLAMDRKSGRILWERTAYEGVPKEKRHMKSTYASSTPATDGEVVIAFFGSQGIYAYTTDGKPLWSRDLGRLDVGAYNAPDYEWGTASSPVLYKDLAIAQCDQQKGSFLIALDRTTGKTVWKTERDEFPSWGTPAIVTGGNRTELVTNASNFIRGYDPETGKELWRLGGSSKITAPTPVFANGLILVASGRRPEAPIFAIRWGAAGDITLASGQTSSASIAWSKQQRGPYMPTPLIYEGLVYVLNNPGIFDVYELESGKEIYRQRIEHQGSGFSASPIASDRRIFLTGEDGEIFVVKAGRQFELIAKNEMGEPQMATPAISGGMLIVRSQYHMWAIGKR